MKLFIAKLFSIVSISLLLPLGGAPSSSAAAEEVKCYECFLHADTITGKVRNVCDPIACPTRSTGFGRGKSGETPLIFKACTVAGQAARCTTKTENVGGKG